MEFINELPDSVLASAAGLTLFFLAIITIWFINTLLPAINNKYRVHTKLGRTLIEHIIAYKHSYSINNFSMHSNRFFAGSGLTFTVEEMSPSTASLLLEIATQTPNRCMTAKDISIMLNSYDRKTILNLINECFKYAIEKERSNIECDIIKALKA